MATYRITVAYDGTDYVGWQRQAAGTSIQGLLEEALRELDGRDVTVTGAGRTDAGVHAIGQVAGFVLERAMAPDAVVRAINARLPDAVRVTSAAAVPASFHARFHARTKTYRYRIWNGDVMPPFERRYAWHVVGALDVARMQEAARMVEGEHDFAAFQSSGTDVVTTMRTVHRSALCLRRSVLLESSSLESALLEYDVAGDGFLRHMVRALVGSLVEVGRGRQAPDWMARVIASRDRAAAGPTAPAHGLFLVGVAYADALAAEC